VLSVLLAAATFHDKSKVPFFIAAGVLVAWALLVSAVGIRGGRFPTSTTQGRAVMGISAVLVAVTAAMGIVTAKTPPPAHPYDTTAVTNGVAPTITPLGSSGATGTTTPPSGSSGGALQLAANPSGQLAYNTKTLTAPSSNVTIDFTNKSPLPHNVTIANASGKVLGATPTFSGGEKTLKLNLPPGTYTFYCSVPGHEQAGMKGTLTVR
jgi:plastocyanin